LTKDGFRVVGAESWPVCTIQFQLNNPDSPWHDRRVRLAIAHAVDGDAIVKGLLQGIPKRYPGLAKGEFGYDPTLTNYSYDPALSGKLLADAGYPKGFTMPLYYWAGTFYGIRETAEAVALYLKQNLNITSRVQGIQLIQLLGLIGKSSHDPKAEYVAVAGLPVANLATPIEGVSLAYYGKSPFSLYHNSDLDVIFEKAEATLDPAKQAPLIKQMMAIEQEDLPTITLWQYVDVYAMKKNITYTPGLDYLEVVYLPWVHDAM
jgi:peptide/nickel transport system substrate-binding protein